MRGTAPTGRAALCLAVIAVAALLVPLALVAGAAVVLLAAGLADAWTVRRGPATIRHVPELLSRGVATALDVDVDVDVDVDGPAARGRTVLLRQPATLALAVQDGRGAGRLRAQVTARRRGRHELPPVASASLGPLGLARVGHRPGVGGTVSVYPDLVGALRLITRLQRELAGHPGRLARGPLGLGTDFESVREYSSDDDIRQLNWRQTARLGRPMSNQYRLERDREVTCLVDCGRLMTAPLEGRTMLDCALDAVTAIALAADTLGDRCGALAFDAEIRRAVPAGRLSGRRVIDGLFDLEASTLDTDFERAFVRVARSRRGVIVVFTDLVDEAAARSLQRGIPMLAHRHTVLVACVSDPVLTAAIEAASPAPLPRAAATVARDVLATRELAAVGLRRAGAVVLEAPANALPARCLDAYLSLKRRGRG
jgi:uncharacterized protein (DUF58 family)